ncbi:putative stress-associated endoplasmic reticulum protein [Lupinus albus]|uniref:Putative stress-associated endoplasmic reticulum protein n=1 Tax=Lupinus albus TaxID=3870 RepID=A0A6A4PI60_LUPAL|nr:putative stress-associated endoplasmic reticulum protein [Lupinus albus]
MTTSRRLAERKIVKFDKNITKRGLVPETTAKKGKDYPVGPFSRCFWNKSSFVMFLSKLHIFLSASA